MPLTRSKPLKRTPFRTKANPDKSHPEQNSPARRKPNRDTGFPPPVRRLIDWRDSDYGQLPPGWVRCQACGLVIRKEHGSRQHRIARSAGGSRNPVISSVINGVWLHGSATSPGCHRRAEDRSPFMYDDGFWRRQDDIDELPFIPVIRWDGRAYWPTGDGRWVPESPAGGAS